MTDLTKLRAELRAGLDGVTPGPWQRFRSDPAEGVNCHWIQAQPPPALAARGLPKEVACVEGGYTADAEDERTAAHIARCSPENIRAILDALDAVLAREAATIARYDAKLEAAEREREEARAEAAKWREEQRCECSDDDACRFARERDEAQKIADSMTRLFNESQNRAFKAERERDEARRELAMKWCLSCGTVSPTGECDCTGIDWTKDKRNAVDFADEYQKTVLAEIKKLEREREDIRQERDEARAALATARRDALEEAAAVAEDHMPASQDDVSDIIAERCEIIAAAIRDLKDRTP